MYYITTCDICQDRADFSVGMSDFTGTSVYLCEHCIVDAGFMAESGYINTDREIYLLSSTHDAERIN